MTVFLEPFPSVYDDRSRLGIILARGRGGFEAYSADDHSLGLFPSPRKAAAAITTTRPWVAHGQSSGWPISLDSIATRRGRQCGGGSTWITRKGLRPEGWPSPFVIDATAASFLLILHYRGLRRKEFLDMCDYSLHSVRTRPAKVGEKLVTHNFGDRKR